MSGERQVPFYCPYCGEENLRPSGAEAGDWECLACARGFQLRFTAVTRPRPAESQSRPAESRPRPAESRPRPAESRPRPAESEPRIPA